MISKAQRSMLFAHFKKLADARGWTGPTAACRRDELTVRALGIDPMKEVIPSWSDLTEPQVDALKQRMVEDLGEQMAVTITDGGTETLADARRRSRLTFAIVRDLAAAYGSETAAETAAATICSRVLGENHPSALGRWRRLPIDDDRVPFDLVRMARTAGRCERQRRRQNSKYPEYSRRPGQIF